MHTKYSSKTSSHAGEEVKTPKKAGLRVEVYTLFSSVDLQTWDNCSLQDQSIRIQLDSI